MALAVGAVAAVLFHRLAEVFEELAVQAAGGFGVGEDLLEPLQVLLFAVFEELLHAPGQGGEVVRQFQAPVSVQISIMRETA